MLRVHSASVEDYRSMIQALAEMTGGAVTERDVELIPGADGAEIRARSDRGRVFLRELDRVGGESKTYDPDDGVLDHRNLIHVRQLAASHSLGRAMMASDVLPLFGGVEAQEEEGLEGRADGMHASVTTRNARARRSRSKRSTARIACSRTDRSPHVSLRGWASTPRG